MKKNKGISLIAVTITVIVIIILAAIALSRGTEDIDNANKAVFQNDFKSAVELINIYNTQSELRKNNRDYNPEELTWDGKSERAENTARIENPDEEDRIEFILNRGISKDLENKIDIREGKLYVKEEFPKQKEWAGELYKYLRD